MLVTLPPWQKATELYQQRRCAENVVAYSATMDIRLGQVLGDHTFVGLAEKKV